MSDLPTKPGVYYLLETVKDEWEPVKVYVSGEICGQWLRIPTAEELVKDGFEGAYVVTSVSGRRVSIDFTEPRAWALAERLEGIFQCDLKSSGYTCEPVTIVRKEKR